MARTEKKHQKRPKFDRCDICEAYLVFEFDWKDNGWLRERESNQRRRESTAAQLNRMRFYSGPHLWHRDHLTENGRAIYHNLLARYRLPNTTED